jgi:Leucine-rich repeat (LRR) protein
MPLAALSSLAHLDLSNNSITGTFPTTLYRCCSLHYLDLSQNNIGGELPHDLGHGLEANLSTLVLSSNKLNGSGSIPTSLSRLRNLRCLHLDSNGLTGTIPAELGELRSL